MNIYVSEQIHCSRINAMYNLTDSKNKIIKYYYLDKKMSQMSLLMGLALIVLRVEFNVGFVLEVL